MTVSEGNKEKQQGLARLERLRKKGTVTDDAAELASYREDKYSNSDSGNSKRKPVDLDSFVIPSGRSIEDIDNYIKELREDRTIQDLGRER